jgi:STAS-like domain of unknown function (DUF4325)
VNLKLNFILKWIDLLKNSWGIVMIIKMSDFGKLLTDREDGKKAFNSICAKSGPPYILDFTDILAMGSSFGDEVVGKLALVQGKKIEVQNVSMPIKSCLSKIEEDYKIRILYL